MSEIPFRRTLVATGALITATALAACSSSSGNQVEGRLPAHPSHTAPAPTSESTEPIRAAYVPDWLPSERYSQLRTQLGKNAFNRYYLAFAIPTPEGTITPPRITPEIARLVGGKGTEVLVSIGGYGGDEKQHQQITQGWKHALQNPADFAKRTEVMRQKVEKDLQAQSPGVKVGIDLDYEYPTADEKNQYTALVQTIRKTTPANLALTAAVPARANLEGFDFKPGGPLDSLNQVNVMTYDYSGPWGNAEGQMEAGHLAPGKDVIEDTNKWVERMDGDPTKVVTGFPTYGYIYRGADEIGDPIKESGDAEVAYSDIPQRKITDDLATLTTTAEVGGHLVTTQSPYVTGKIVETIRKDNPGIGAFLWDCNGATPERVKALQSNR